MPAETLHFTAVRQRADDLRRETRPPLREQMAHAEAAKTKPFSHLEKAPEPIEIEGVTAGCRIVADLQQLAGRPFGADFGVERRRPERRVKRVDSVTNRIPGESFDDLPVFFAPAFHAVIRGEAVGMEPLVADQFLRRQRDIDRLKRERAPGAQLFPLPGEKRKAEFIFARHAILRHRNRHPEYARLARKNPEAVAVLETVQEIRVEPRRRPQKIPELQALNRC